MPKVEENGIVFEYPDDVEVPAAKPAEEKEVEVKEATPKKEAKVEEKDFDLEIEDDTPPEDRNKEPLPKEVVEEIEKDTLDDYSERVRTRLSQMKKGWHDERRAKEEADRERQEAIKYAQRVAEENRRLKTTLESGEATYIETLKNSLEHELALAKEAYRKAYDSGETDSIIDAQSKMNDAQFRLSQAKQYEPRYKNALQEQENPVYISQNEQPSFKPDDRALKWQEKNDWFGKDEEMTSLALGLHEKLVRSGVSPTSDEYYRRIDSTMQKRFPE